MRLKSVKENIRDWILILVLFAIIWIGMSTFIQRFICPAMTETQLLLHIPKSFICDWRHCE